MVRIPKRLGINPLAIRISKFHGIKSFKARLYVRGDKELIKLRENNFIATLLVPELRVLLYVIVYFNLETL